LTLLPTLTRPRWPNLGRYMPHIVLGDPNQREARLVGNQIVENYLGVWVTNAPDELLPGETAEVTLVLMYWPEEEYKDAVSGSAFTLREGPNIVGFGEIVSESAYIATHPPN